MDLGDLGDGIERYIEDNFPEGVHIPIANGVAVREKRFRCLCP